MAIYGDFITNFSELFQPINFWQMDAEVYGWGDKYNEKTINGIILRGDNFEQLFGNAGRLTTRFQWRTVDIGDEEFLYIEEGTVAIGWFMTHPISGLVYRLMESNDFMREGGFILFTVKKLTGTVINRTPTPFVLSRV